MNSREFLGNAAVAVFAQGVTLLLSCVTALVVPKSLGVTEYGYWQLFMFYAGYVGFFHFGLNDGVYLQNGGRLRDELDARPIVSQLVFGTAVQLLMGLVIVVAALASPASFERTFVICATAFVMVAKNAALFLGYLFQSMNETRLYSASCILERVVFGVPLVALIAVGCASFEPFVAAYCLSTLSQLLFCIFKARDILAARPLPLPASARLCVQSVRVGIKLMLANIAGQLVIGVTRLVVDAAWGIETFGMLSFSLTLVTFALSFVVQVAMVLFPALRRVTTGKLRTFVRTAGTAVSLVMPCVYLLYYPLAWLLGLWLPAYAESFTWFAWLLPICVFDCKTSLVSSTYLKVTRREGLLFRVNAAMTIASAAGSLVSVFVLDSLVVLIAVMVAAIVVRSLVFECLVASLADVACDGTLIVGELVVTAVFLLSTAFAPSVLAQVALTACAYALFLIVNRRDLIGLFARAIR